MRMSRKRIDPDSIDIGVLKQEFNRFREELSGMGDKIGGSATAALDEISAYLNGDGMSARMASFESELGHLAEMLKGGGRDAVTRLEKQVEYRPMISLAVAFGVGLVTAQFLRRS